MDKEIEKFLYPWIFYLSHLKRFEMVLFFSKNTVAKDRKAYYTISEHMNTYSYIEGGS